MSVLKKLFNNKVNQNSPIFKEDLVLTIKRGKDGEEKIVFLPEDCKKIQEANGTVDMWKLDTLLAAGINPASMHVHTGLNTRLEGVGIVDEFSALAEEVLSADLENNKE